MKEGTLPLALQNLPHKVIQWKLDADKLDNLDEMELFLPIHKLLKLTQEDIDDLNRVIRSEKIELVIKTLPTKKSPHPDGFTAKF